MSEKIHQKWRNLAKSHLDKADAEMIHFAKSITNLSKELKDTE